MSVQNIAVFEREEDSSAVSDESSEESDEEDNISDSPENDTDSVQSEQHKDREAKRTTHSCQLPRLKMPKTSSKRRSQPCVEVLHSSDSNVQDSRNDQLH